MANYDLQITDAELAFLVMSWRPRTGRRGWRRPLIFGVCDFPVGPMCGHENLSLGEIADAPRQASAPPADRKALSVATTRPVTAHMPNNGMYAPPGEVFSILLRKRICALLAKPFEV